MTDSCGSLLNYSAVQSGPSQASCSTDRTVNCSCPDLKQLKAGNQAGSLTAARVCVINCHLTGRSLLCSTDTVDVRGDPLMIIWSLLVNDGELPRAVTHWCRLRSAAFAFKGSYNTLRTTGASVQGRSRKRRDISVTFGADI